MNCLIYLRVSTKEQAEGGYSIAAQKEGCLKHIKDNGWNFVDEYADRGESARSAHRPQLQEMLHLLKENKEIDVILVHKIDRLARNVEDHAAIRAILRKNNTRLVSVTENIEDSASGRLVENIFASFAEFYSANLANEIKKGLLQKVKEGGYPALAPTGYKNIRDERGKAFIVPNVEVAPLVQEAFKLYATGEYSARQVYEMVASRGLISPMSKKQIVLSKFIEMLKNKAYIGIVNFKGVEYQGKHEPLVSKRLFMKAQDIFADHDKAGLRIRKHPHYLRGTLYCGYCGERMSSSIAKGKYLHFYCLGKRRGVKCQQGYVTASDIEKGILKLYKNIQLPDEQVKKLTIDLEKELMDQESYSIKQREFITKRMAKLNRDREKLLDAYIAEAIPRELLKKRQDEISSEMMNLESKQETTSVHLDQIEKSIRLTIKMAANCYFAYEKASESNKKLFNKAFFEKMYLKGTKISGFEHAEAFKYLYNDKSSNKTPLVEIEGFEPSAPTLPA